MSQYAVVRESSFDMAGADVVEAESHADAAACWMRGRDDISGRVLVSKLGKPKFFEIKQKVEEVDP